MSVHYRSHDVLITSEAYVWRTDPIRVFRLRYLSDVGIVRGDLEVTRFNTTHTTALGVGAITAVSWTIIESPIALGAGVALAVALALAATHAGRDRTRWMELHATYGGTRVVLFASADGQTFRQVTRGLMRAMEASGPPSSWYELAGG